MGRGRAPAVGLQQRAELGALQFAVLDHERAAGAQQARARAARARARRRGRPGRRTARAAGSYSRTSGSRGIAPSGMYGGFETTTSSGAVEFGQRVGEVDEDEPQRWRRRSRCDVLARPDERARRVLDAQTAACGTSVASASAIAPLPVPRSTATRLRRRDGPQRVDGDLRHELGLRARHEDAGPDGELERAERRDAGDVLQRFARRPALDRLDERDAVVGRARRLR